MLTIHKKDATQGSSGSIIADRALALDKDDNLVDGDSTKAVSVVCGEGGTIPGAEVARLRLVIEGGKVKQTPKAEPAPAGAKQAAFVPDPEAMREPRPGVLTGDTSSKASDPAPKSTPTPKAEPKAKAKKGAKGKKRT